MFRYAPVALAALMVVAPTASAKGHHHSSTSATLEWEGEVRHSCALSAEDEGTLAMTPDGQWIESDEQGTPAVLDVEVVGGTATVQVSGVEVNRNGSNTNNLATNPNAEVFVQIEGDEQIVWDNQRRTDHGGWSFTDSQEVEVDVRTNGHRDVNDQIVAGDYVVQTTVECTIK